MAYAARRPSATASTTVAAPIAHVARAEDARATGRERDRVGEPARWRVAVTPSAPRSSQVQLWALTDGEQDPVALDDELGARHRLGAAPAGRVGRARGPCAGTRRRVTWPCGIGHDPGGRRLEDGPRPSSIISWTSFAAGMSFMSRR